MLRHSHNVCTYEQKVVKRAPPVCPHTPCPACQRSWYAPVFLLMRGLPARKLTVRQKTARVGPRCLSSGRQWQCFHVHSRTIRGSDSAGFGQECLVGLNVRRPTARMQAVLLITSDLLELRNKSWLDFYLQHWYCTWVSQMICRSLSRISSLDSCWTTDWLKKGCQR